MVSAVADHREGAADGVFVPLIERSRQLLELSIGGSEPVDQVLPLGVGHGVDLPGSVPVHLLEFARADRLQQHVDVKAGVVDLG